MCELILGAALINLIVIYLIETQSIYVTFSCLNFRLNLAH